ncbi:MAG: redoxin domain-containing protein [Candidatus Poribacteria bacterium]
MQRDGGMLIFSMELNDAPAGYVTPSRLVRDVAAMIEDFANDGGDSAGRYHAEDLLRAWNHDREGAARAMKQAVTRKPDDIQILYHHARLLHQMGRHDEAIPPYERIVASDRRVMRQWEETHRHLSELYVGANADSKHRKLIAGFDEYVTGGSRHLQGNLLRMYSGAGMFTEVTEKGDALLKVNANDSTVANLIADAHRELGNADEADRYHRLANAAYDLVGRKAPTFTLEDAQGVVYKSADISGPILLNLWWSGGFAEHGSQIAALEALHGKYADDGLVVLGGCVSTDMGGRARELGLVDGVATFPILFDGRTAYQAYSVKRTATFLIDSTGHIRYVTTDPDKDAGDMEEAVLAVLTAVNGTAGAGVRIAGVARDEHGAPVVDAAITLYMVDNMEAAHREVARAVSGTDGAFDFGEHPPLDVSAHEIGGHYQVIAIADDQSLGLAYINGVTDDPGAADLGFTRPTRVEGTVSDETGKPIVGARVFVRSAMAKQPGDDNGRGGHRLLLLSLQPGDVLSATTAADGSFTIERAPSNTAGMLSVHHPDYARVHENYDASSGQQVAFALPGAGTLTGRVYYADMLAGGSPDRALAPGVEVRVQSAMPAAVSRAAYRGGKGRDRHFGAGVSTDNQGRYRIEGIPPGYLNIWASADGYTCVAWDTYGITEGGVHEADLYLIKGGFIVGSVVDDETGKAVRPGERSDVGLYGPSKPISGAAIDYARIAEDGTFRLRAAPGANFPYLRSRPPWTVVGPPDRVQQHTVNVENGKTVEGCSACAGKRGPSQLT